MPAAVLFLGMTAFLFSLTLHVILWRLRRPRHHVLALLTLFFIAGIFLLFSLGFFFGPLSGTDQLAALLLYAALSCGYIQLYPASQANSPSVAILTAVRKSMPRGMSESEIRSLLDPEQTFHDRVDDLVISGLMTEAGGKLSLTGRGRAFILPFIVYRRLLGVPEGKG